MTPEFDLLVKTLDRIEELLHINPRAQEMVQAGYEKECAICAELELKGDGLCGEHAMEPAEARMER